MFSVALFFFSVCLSISNIIQKLWMDCDEILWRGPKKVKGTNDLNYGFHCNPFITFWVILLTNKQIARQSNGTENTSTLFEIISNIKWLCNNTYGRCMHTSPLEGLQSTIFCIYKTCSSLFANTS